MLFFILYLCLIMIGLGYYLFINKRTLSIKSVLPVLLIAIALTLVASFWHVNNTQIIALLDSKMIKSKELTEEYDKLKEEYKELSKELEKQTEDIKDYQDKYNRAKTENEKLEEEIEKLTQKNKEFETDSGQKRLSDTSQNDLSNDDDLNITDGEYNEDTNDTYMDETETSIGDCDIKGSENGIYHTPGSTYYSRTTNVVEWFCTIEEARKAGYRAPKR